MAVVSRVRGRGLVALLILAVFSSVLAILPAPTVASADPADIKEVQTLDRPANPGWQLVIGDETRYLSRNDLGLIADKYGTTADPICTPTTEGVCSDRGKYYGYQEFADEGPTAGFTALLDVDGDHELDRLVITPSGDVVVNGNRSKAYDGFTANGDQLVSAEVLGALQNGHDGSLGILTTSGLHVFQLDVPSSVLHTVGVFGTAALGFDPALVLQVKQRDPFIQYSENVDGEDEGFLALSYKGDGTDDLELREVRWNSDNTFTAMSVPATLAQGAPVRDARMAFDYVDHGVGDEPAVAVLSYSTGVRDGHLSFVEELESQPNHVVARPACPTDDPNATPSVEVQAVIEGIAPTGDPMFGVAHLSHVAYGCASVVDGSGVGSLDRLHRDVFQQRGRFNDARLVADWSHSEELGIGVTMHDPQLQLYFPCAATLGHQTPPPQPDGTPTPNPCANNGAGQIAGYGDTLGSVVVAKRGDSAIDAWNRSWSALTYDVFGAHGGDPILGDYRTLESNIADAAGKSLQVLPLDFRIVKQRVRITNRMHPETVTTDPIPLGLLVAPPYVRGAEQAMAAPEFAKSEASGTTESRSTSVDVGVSVGGGYNGTLYAVDISARLGVEYEHEESVSKEIERTDFFEGAEGENSIVYQAVVAHRYNAEVIESSDGLTYGETFPILFPVTTTTDVASEETFRSLDGGTAGVRYGNALNLAMPDAGNPGSYLSGGTVGSTEPSVEVDSYCNASRAHPSSSLVPNPFRPLPDVEAPDPGSSILLGHEAVVTAGPGASAVQGSEISITNSNSKSDALTLSVGVDTEFLVSGVAFGADVTTATGDGIENSTSNGTSFSAGVGDIPSAELAGEGYRWKTFLCKRVLDTANGAHLPVWVLNYTVDDYFGTGGLEENAPVDLTSPILSQQVSRQPSFTWTQDEGTTKDWSLELEAVGAPDHRVINHLLPQATPAAANAAAASRSVTWAGLSQSTQLLANQVYRWRTTATDFFGRQTQSEYQYLVTLGPPRNLSLQPSNIAPTVNEGVTLTALHDPTVVTDYAWNLGNGSPVQHTTVPTLTYSWPGAGLYPVQVTVTNSSGSATASSFVSVGPSATDDTYSATEDTLRSVAAPGVLGNDLGGGTASLQVQAAHGTAVVTGNGAFTYDPAPNFCGTDAFVYNVLAGTASRQAQVTMNVACVNDTPVPTSSSITVVEDGNAFVAAPGLLALVTDVDSSSVFVTKVTDPSHGSAFVDNSSGAYSYTPAAGYCGADSFTWKASDSGSANSAPVTVSITVTCVNDPPVAHADSTLSVDEDHAATVDVLHNDTDADHDGLTAVVVADPAHGALEDNDGDGITYRPAADYCGPDSFGYQADDGVARSATVTITVNVSCVNDAPKATDTSGVTGPEDAAITKDLGLSDVDDSVAGLLVHVTDNPNHGSVQIVGGKPKYTPNANFCGADSFKVTVSDGHATTSPYQIGVTIECVNDAPVAVADPLVNATEDTAKTIDPLSNDSDVDHDQLSVVITGAPDHGTATTDHVGKVTYTPAAEYCGPDSLTYVATDGTLQSGPITIAISVTCVNDAPNPGPAPAAPIPTQEDTPLSNTPSIGDPDSPPGDLHIVIVTPPLHGTVVVVGGTITYTPAPNYCGPDSYTYKVTDGVSSSPPVIVPIAVMCVNDPPVPGTGNPADQHKTVDQGTGTLSAPAPGLLGNSTDPDGDVLVATLVTPPAHGTATVNPNGAYSYTPTVGYCGVDSFVYGVSDGHGPVQTASITIEIRCTTALALTTSASPAAPGDSITLTAKVTSSVGPPPGTVTFSVGTTPIASCTAKPLSSTGTATCVIPNMVEGGTVYIAKYSGAPFDGAHTFLSSSNLISQVVLKIPTTITLEPAVVQMSGLSFKLKMSSVLKVAATGQPLVGKTVRYVTGTTAICTAVTDTNGRATCNGLLPLLTTLLSAGYDARFDGDVRYQASQGHGPLIG